MMAVLLCIYRIFILYIYICVLFTVEYCKYVCCTAICRLCFLFCTVQYVFQNSKAYSIWDDWSTACVSNTLQNKRIFIGCALRNAYTMHLTKFTGIIRTVLYSTNPHHALGRCVWGVTMMKSDGTRKKTDGLGGGVTQYNAVYHNVWKCSYISYSNCTVLIISKHCDRLRHYWSISIVQTSFDYVFQWTLRKWFVLHLDCVRKPCLIIVLHLEPLWIYKKVSVWICLDDVIRGCGHFDGHQHTHRVKSQRNWSHSI